METVFLIFAALLFGGFYLWLGWNLMAGDHLPRLVRWIGGPIIFCGGMTYAVLALLEIVTGAQGQYLHMLPAAPTSTSVWG